LKEAKKKYVGYEWGHLGFFERLGLYISFLWRGLVVALFAGMLGWFLSNSVAAIMTGAGLVTNSGMTRTFTTVWFAKALVSLLVGAMALFVYLNWLLRTRFGDVRLGFIKEPVPEPAAPQPKPAAAEAYPPGDIRR
jgi:hypothetical protein